MRLCLSTSFVPARAMRFLASRRESGENMYKGTTNTVIVYHPEDASRRSIQDACVKSIGEQSLRIHTPRDRETGQKKGHSYLVLSTPDVAEELAKKGLDFKGEQFKAVTAPDSEDVDKVGVTRKMMVRFPESISAEDVERELLRVAGQRPSRLQRNPAGSAIYATFDSPDTVVKIVANGLVVGGEELNADYADDGSSERSNNRSASGGNDRSRSERPRREDRPRDDREGSNADAVSLSLIGLSENVGVAELSALVKKATGSYPVKVNFNTSPSGVTLAFVEMATPAKARALLDASIAGMSDRPVGLRLLEEKRPSNHSELVGKTARLSLSVASGTIADALSAVQAKAGEELQDLVQTDKSARFSLSSPRAALRLFEEGVEIAGGHSVRLRLVATEAEGTPSQQLFLSRLPANATDAAVTEAIQALFPGLSVSVQIVKDRQTGETRFGFASFADAAAATQVLRSGLKVNGTPLKMQFSKPSERVVTTKSFEVRPDSMFLAFPGTTLSEADLRKAIPKTDAVAVVDGETRVYLRNLAAADSAATQGVTVNGELLKPRLVKHVLNADLSGAVNTLHLGGVPASLDEQTLISAVEAATGHRPTRVYKPEGKAFAFVSFPSNEVAAEVANKEFRLDGQLISIGFQKPKQDQDDKPERKEQQGSQKRTFQRREEGGKREGGSYQRRNAENGRRRFD